MPPKRAAATSSAAATTAAYELSDDSLDDDGLFDELESDEEDLKPSTGGGKNKPFDTATILKGQLNQPRHMSFSAKHIHDLIHMGGVTLNPSYQRDVVWPEAKMIALIQSLMLNYYIPPVVFAVEDTADDKLRVCIDGKQRCTSIVYFMDGKIPFISPHTKTRFWYNKQASGRPGTQLPMALKNRFDTIAIQVVEYDNIPDEQQRDIFQRVQMGVALSPAEKLQAIPGPWPEWILALERKYIAEPDTLSTILDWDIKRGKPFQNLAGFLMIAIDTSKQVVPTAASQKAFVSRADPPEGGFKKRVEMALSLFINLASNHYDLAFKSTPKRLAPVEFWFIAYLIYLRMGNLSLQRIAEKVSEIRATVHARFPGRVYANKLVMSTIREMINAIPKKRTLNEIPAAEEFEGDEDVDARDQRAMKRNRKEDERDPTYAGEAIERTIGGPANSPITAKRSKQNADAGPAPRPAPVDVKANIVQRANGGAGSLPTPQTSVPQQNPYQPQPRATNGQNYSPSLSHAQAYPQPGQQYHQQQQQQPTSWPAGQPMTAEQLRAYTQQRVYQQQQQQRQGGQQQYYG
ncbi:hypothetical protein CI109_107328 [Kwoniella shandongensis]|uniref:GmrSD restriction endonucleases N-terminal domain-containing protein n=1 Tax=Kwoniella shandongensis TaxID=1734106 RepID=A0A5M6BVU9_9TREE|nr:uncharacterized protein CI109_004744 [Kwoniella shandongensis]KAA5526967.1 hypothetical protein CI109_004744 [Kwoniella shandongensis]